jgi:hypothetical protein
MRRLRFQTLLAPDPPKDKLILHHVFLRLLASGFAGAMYGKRSALVFEDPVDLCVR